MYCPVVAGAHNKHVEGVSALTGNGICHLQNSVYLKSVRLFKILYRKFLFCALLAVASVLDTSCFRVDNSFRILHAEEETCWTRN